MKMRFCAKCGYPLPINVKSCIECGAPVEDDMEEQELMSESEGQPERMDDTPHGAHAAAANEASTDSREATPIAWPVQTSSDTTVSDDGDSEESASADKGANEDTADAPEPNATGDSPAVESVQGDGPVETGSSEETAGESMQNDDEAAAAVSVGEPEPGITDQAETTETASSDGPSTVVPTSEAEDAGRGADAGEPDGKGQESVPADAQEPSVETPAGDDSDNAADEGVMDTTVPETALHPAYTVRRSKFAPPLPREPKPAPMPEPEPEPPAQEEPAAGVEASETSESEAQRPTEEEATEGQPSEEKPAEHPTTEQPTAAIPRTAAAVPVSLYGTASDRTPADELPNDNADEKTESIPAVSTDRAADSAAEQKTQEIPAVAAGVGSVSDTPAARADRVAQGQTAAMPKIGQEGAGSDIPASAKVRRVSSSNRPQKQSRSQRKAAEAEFVSQAKERSARAAKENAGQQPVRPAVMVAEKRSKKPLIAVIVIVVVLAIVLAVLHPWAQEGGNGASSSTEQVTSSATQESSSSSSESSSSSTEGSSKSASGTGFAAGAAGTAASSAATSGTGIAAGTTNGGAATATGGAAGAGTGTAQSAGGNTTANGGTTNAGTTNGGTTNGGTGTGNGTGNAGTGNGGSGTGGNTTAKKITTGSSSYALTVISSSGVRLSGTVHRKASGYVIPDSSTKAYTLKQLKKMGLSDAELCIAWNEPYARLGAHFANPALQAYFESCSWYHDLGKTGIQLSGVAAKNVNLLHKLAEQKASSKRWESLATS